MSSRSTLSWILRGASPSASYYAAFCALITTVLTAGFIWFKQKSRLRPSLPPGPKPVFALGNIRDITSSKEVWLPATKWAKEFGSVVYLHILGQGLVFLNTPEAAYDLMDKRGSIYSDKPQLVMVGELCGCKDVVAFAPYGDQSKRQRKVIQKGFGPSSIRQYQPLIEVETHAFLRRLLRSPSNYIEHMRRYAGGLTLFVVYGHEVKSDDDEFLQLAEHCVWLLSNKIASSGGIWPVDIFPFLKHIPSWVPGMAFKRNAAKWKASMQEFVDKPFDYVQENMKAGTARPSLCSTLLDGEKTKEEIFDIKTTANSMYSGSIDTTVTFTTHFILAMVQHPEVFAKCQQEIDSVVGLARLPAFEDRPNLPYLECAMNECLRWAAPVPLNLPHRLMEDDVYKDMFLPKGSLIIGNIWAILRDGNLYPDPERFNPERFMEPVDDYTAKRRDPRNYAFGFGRRRCPGTHLVESSAWLLMASTIAAFDLSKAKDGQGNIVDPIVRFEDSVFRKPSPFECSIKPRSEQAAKLISQTTLTA